MSRIARTVVLEMKTSDFKVFTRSHTPRATPSSGWLVTCRKCRRTKLHFHTFDVVRPLVAPRVLVCSKSPNPKLAMRNPWFDIPFRTTRAPEFVQRCSTKGAGGLVRGSFDVLSPGVGGGSRHRRRRRADRIDLRATRRIVGIDHLPGNGSPSLPAAPTYTALHRSGVSDG